MDDGPRARKRTETDRRIIEAARRQLAEHGAAELSLRSVAREVGLVSSAVYRYVEHRDELLTRLIVAAYDSLGASVEAAVGERDGDLERWTGAAGALRTWALASPHEYLLLYGTPVHGYAAPVDTVVPGTRVLRALAGLVDDAHRSGRLRPADPAADIDAALHTELARLADLAGIGIEPSVVLPLLVGWTQMFGLVGFELTNQTRGVVEHHELLFDACADRTGRAIGLR